MKFIPGNYYHVYNRGNNKRPIFLEPRNYKFFIRKMKRYLLPYCDLVAYVLMPNHFHFLIAANEDTTAEIRKGPFAASALSEGLRLLTSSYAKAINSQEGFTGSLFQQKTKSKCVLDRIDGNHEEQYAATCFHYIHLNPVKAGLVTSMKDWQYSSYGEYAGIAANELCRLEKGYLIAETTAEKFEKHSLQVAEQISDTWLDKVSDTRKV